MRYSQGDGVHTPLDWLVLYPRSVLVIVVLCIGLPTARSCAALNDNNKDGVCTRTIPAGLTCPPPSKTISLITWFEAYLNNLYLSNAVVFVILDLVTSRIRIN